MSLFFEIQGWGMTETGPIGSLSRHSNKASDMKLTEKERLEQQCKQGLLMPGLTWKLVETEDFSKEVPKDGKSVGDLLIKYSVYLIDFFMSPHT